MGFKKVVIFGIGMLFIFSAGYAQVPEIEKATREVDRPKPKELMREKLPALPSKGPEIKTEEGKEEAGQKVFIKQIKLIGCESVSSEEFASITKNYENREVGLEELKTLTKKIEREYLRKGVVSACFIPPQEIKGEEITLQVVEARMGELEVGDQKYFDKERIAYYWKLKPDEILNYDALGQSLQLINKNPDREAKATLHAGKKPRTTDILIETKTTFPFHLTSTFDREGSFFTGRGRIGVGFKHNNFLRLDDALLAGYSFGSHFDSLYVYHSLPVTNFGTSLMYGYSYSKSFPKKELTVSAIDSRAKNTSFFINQDLFKKEKYFGEIKFGLDIKDKSTKGNTGTINRDRLRILRTSGSFVKRTPGSITQFDSEISQGINSLGARKRTNLSSRGAKGTFSKLEAGVKHKTILPLNLQTVLSLKGLVSSTKLTPQEEFSLGGIDSVRGYPSGDYYADTAGQGNFEILIPAFFIPSKVKLPYATQSLKNDLTPLLFVDYGWGRRRGALITEKGTVNLKSAGFGVRARLFDQTLLRLEWGFRFGDKGITETGDSRFHFSVNFEDRLPEEIARIKQLAQEENIKQWAQALLNEGLKGRGGILERLNQYLRIANIARKEGNLEKAKEYYGKVEATGKALNNQALTYVKESLSHQKQLKEYKELAVKYYDSEEFEKAKEIWQKIIKEAEIKPLVLELPKN